MSNIDTVNELLTAINFDRFHEIEARHAPGAVFSSFRGPTLRSAVDIADWHREFLKDYADCNYGGLEYIEDGDAVVVRANLEAKGYDWRLFTQRVLEVLHVDGEEIAERRLYGMLRDIEFDKPVQQAMDNALGYKGGSASATRQTVEKFFAAVAAGDRDAAKEQVHEKAVLIDGVYGNVAGFDSSMDLIANRPRPAFGVPRVIASYYGEHTALVEESFDSSRPRQANWLRLVDGKIIVIEVYWMLRDIGLKPDENYANDRHARKVILPA